MQNRRRQYIVNKMFQYKIIFYLAALIVLTVAVSHGLALAFAKWLGSSQASAQMSEALHGTLARPFSWDVVWIPALITVFIGLVLVLVFGRVYSNRIAGPLFNLKRVLARVGGGDLGTRMHIRSQDEFHDVEGVFNQMMAELNQRFASVQKALQELPEPHRTQAQARLAEAFPGLERDKKTERSVQN